MNSVLKETCCAFAFTHNRSPSAAVNNAIDFMTKFLLAFTFVVFRSKNVLSNAMQKVINHGIQNLQGEMQHAQNGIIQERHPSISESPEHVSCLPALREGKRVKRKVASGC